MEYKFRNDAIQWQISKSANAIFYIFIFDKVHTDTGEEMNKAIATGEIADLPKNCLLIK